MFDINNRVGDRRSALGAVVRVAPAGLDVRVAAGESLMSAALRIGTVWPSICSGKAKCGVCAVKVLAGIENIPPATNLEIQALRTFRGIQHAQQPNVRLACQITVTGPVTVEKRGVKIRDAPA